MNLKITLSMIEAHGSVSAAIEAACEEHDTLASGIIGPSFATSGPGSGWSHKYGESDYAARALDEYYGALGYIDSSDGRLATLDDGEVVWSDETVVTVVDDREDVSEETMRLLDEAIDSGHVESEVTTRCSCSSCGCDELATHYDHDAGDRVCEECADYVCDDDGEVYCSRCPETEYAQDGDRTYLRIAPPEMPEEDPTGKWCLYWSTACDGESRVESRFPSREKAEQAMMATDWPPPGDHTAYLCGYEVRQLIDGAWITPED